MSKIGNLSIANATLSQLSYGPDLRFDLRPQKEHLRMVGKDLAAMLPPGARLGLIDPKGYGLADIENGVSATAETVYRIGSITKQFTAAAVMQLVEAGKGDDLTGRGFFPFDFFQAVKAKNLRHPAVPGGALGVPDRQWSWICLDSFGGAG